MILSLCLDHKIFQKIAILNKQYFQEEYIQFAETVLNLAKMRKKTRQLLPLRVKICKLILLSESKFVQHNGTFELREIAQNHDRTGIWGAN